MARSPEEAALLASILAVIASVLAAIPAATNAASHDRGGPGHRGGTRDWPSPKDTWSTDSGST